jgi:hypothetical protein
MMPGGGLTRDRCAGLALTAIAAIVAWETSVLPIGSLARPGPGYLPLALAAIMAGLGLIIAWRGGGSRMAEVSWPEAGHAIKLLGGCAGAALLLEPLGYRLTMFLLVLFFLGAVERRQPFATVATALGLSLGSFWLFANLLRVALPRGPWGF